MARDPELERLTAEVERLRDLERQLRLERERVREEAAGEIDAVRAALREAASNARVREAELDRRALQADAREQELAAREAEVAAAVERVRDADSQLEEERRRLAAWRARLQRESERLAEWERSARAAAAPEDEPRQRSFEEGLRGMSEPGAQQQSSW